MLISALAFTVIIAVCLAGIGTLCVSHYSRASVDGDFASALNLAEAGVNYEFRKISQNAANADQKGGANPPGVTYAFGSGAFRVYCTNKDGSVPWVAPNNLYVISTGVVNGVSRTVKASAKGFGATANYALFGVAEGIINGTAATVNGDVGTDGFFTFNGHPSVVGNVNFNGPGSDWQSPPQGAYSVNHFPSPLIWPTVDTIANQKFPGGGLAWVATHNDNALATPPIVGASILLNGNGTATLHGKAGGANYYLHSLICNGAVTVVFDNAAGPINIWVGPSGTAGNFIFNGGTAAIKMSQDATKEVRIYGATTNDYILNGNAELDAGLYDYNGPSSGRVIFNGSPATYGWVVANKFTLNGTPVIYYVPNLYYQDTGGYYGFDNSWQDLNTSVYN